MPDKCPGGISMLGTDWATRSCLKLLNIPGLISKPLIGETWIKNICIAVQDSPFWGNSKKLKKVHVCVPLCIPHWNSLRMSLWLPRRIRFLTYYSLKVVFLQKDVWGVTEEISYCWQVATQIWVSKDSDWLCYSWGWEIILLQPNRPFTVMDRSEAEADLVLIQTFLLYYVNQVILMLTSIIQEQFP